LALPVFAGISLQVVDQFGVSGLIKGQEGGGRIKVDLNGGCIRTSHKLSAIIIDMINIEVPRHNFFIGNFDCIGNVGGVDCWVPAKLDL